VAPALGGAYGESGNSISAWRRRAALAASWHQAAAAMFGEENAGNIVNA
jgi:hypothetical protein